MHKFLDLLKRFHRDERGAFLAMFGVMAVVLIATAGATVDFTSVQNARTRAQVALDAAALALQPKIYSTSYANQTAMEADIKALADAFLLDRLAGTTYKTASVTAATANKTQGTLTLSANLTAPLYFVSLVGISQMGMNLVSQATKGSQDLEVAVALDVTGSMDKTPSGSSTKKIDSLIAAANDMVDILVLDNQTPTYTKMALIPYSMGVNLGANAANARGTIPAAKGVTNAQVQVGSSKSISGITKANPAVITATNHGFSTGDTVWIAGITSRSDWRGLNNRKYTITKVDNNSFSLNSTSTNGYDRQWESGGTVRKCYVTSCEVVVTSADHGFANSTVVYFTGVGGMTELNGNTFAVNSVTSSTFSLTGTNPDDYSSAYTSGGNAWCTVYGCQYFRFQNPSGSWKIYEVSSCVTERTTSTYQYTDTAPGTQPVGKNYPSSSNNCLTNQIVPLTSNKTTLHNTINGLIAEGSTAGQIGTAWAWYALAPNFASLWPTANQPAAYNTGNLIKVVVIMTDGSFNSIYCNGVIAEDSTSGSGSTSDHIGCNGQNGDPFNQTKSLCDKMKLNTGIIVYTVGFDIADQSDEKSMLQYCASGTDRYKLAANESDLRTAFQQIAQDIAQLRISQ